MKNFLKSISVRNWVKFGISLVALAFVVVTILRQQIFPGDSAMFNLYNGDWAGELTVKVLKTVVIIAACYVVMNIGSLISFLSEKINAQKNASLKTTLLLLGNVLKYVAVIAIILLSLSAWGVDTTAIVTGAGVLTLVIGLGCQTLVSDIVAGIFMLFEGDIKVGDVVVIDGWRGTVLQIGLRRTKIEDDVGNVNIINNSAISNIINNTRDLSVAVVEVGTEYNESILRIEEVLEGAFPEMRKAIPAIVEGPFYKGVSALGESCVNIKLVAKCKESDKYQVERDLNRQIKILFDKNDINIPFNQIVLNTRDPKEPNKTQYVPKKDSKFAQKQGELSKGIEEQN